MLDRQHLALIREVSRAGSVTAAADRLNLSQSAISHAIAKLEDRHQVRVWRKKGRSLELTQAGAYLLDLAERLLPELEHAERVLADIARGRRGALRIGMECHPCEKWLMRVTAPYLAAWPDVDLEVRSAFRFDGVAALQNHEIDVLVTPDPVAGPDLHFAPVFDYELRLAVRSDHPLAGRSFVEPSDLTGEDLLTVPVPIERLDIYTRFLIPAACRPGRRVPVESLDLMLQLVVAGRGVSVLPDWLLREMAVGMPIATLGIGAGGLQKSINVGLRRSDLGTDYVAGFLAVAGEVRP
ncbi:LysR family transcriptional regulator [Rubellimicrobium arenae]|uniref:LysR family transcriptional regulator n=1 Tax=Rubellimicrobium arenae TaxID=2817372 RepID=UPI001B3176BC|nr:LysR family transcriptional regulator [Rubellimicrobium arenae]